jgi:hypothetical protein
VPTLLAVMLALGATIGCGGRSRQTDPAPSRPNPTRSDANAIAAIDYRLTTASGEVKATVHIDPDGTTTRLVLGGRTDTRKLAPPVLGELRRKIEEARFATLEPAYRCGGCADQLVHTVSVQVGGTTYTVTAVETADVPDRLMPVLDALGQMGGVGVPWD